MTPCSHNLCSTLGAGPFPPPSPYHCRSPQPSRDQAFFSRRSPIGFLPRKISISLLLTLSWSSTLSTHLWCDEKPRTSCLRQLSCSSKPSYLSPRQPECPHTPHECAQPGGAANTIKCSPWPLAHRALRLPLPQHSAKGSTSIQIWQRTFKLQVKGLLKIHEVQEFLVPNSVLKKKIFSLRNYQG